MKEITKTKEELIEKIVTDEVQYKNKYELMNLYCENRAEQLKDYDEDTLMEMAYGWEWELEDE